MSVHWQCKGYWSLQWRHNGHDSVSSHQPHSCLLNYWFTRRSKKISKLCITGLCAGNSPETGEFPAQMASNAEIFFHLMTSPCVLKKSCCSSSGIVQNMHGNGRNVTRDPLAVIQNELSAFFPIFASLHFMVKGPLVVNGSAEIGVHNGSGYPPHLLVSTLSARWCKTSDAIGV